MDLPPENIAASPASADLTIEEALQRPDPSPDPEPVVTDDGEELPGGAPTAVRDYSGIKWPEDRKAPDFAWIAAVNADSSFDLTADTIEALFRLNRYSPSREADVIGFALRGATLADGHSTINANRIAMTTATPNHRNFRCVIGFYFHGTKKLSAFTGSTVPCRKAIFGSINGGDPSNMLPTGMYTYFVWRHKTLRPALRLAKSKSDLESGAQVTVLRNSNDQMLDTSDKFDPSTPLDNVHCSYLLSESADLGAEFSSWGCLTVRGTKAPSEEWKMFQNVLNGIGLKSRVDLLLSTGREAAIVAGKNSDSAALEATLGALRQGSRGDEVKRVQKELGLDETGFWGPSTADKFTGRQRSLNEQAGNGRVADGIYSHATDTLTGWGVFGNSTV